MDPEDTPLFDKASQPVPARALDVNDIDARFGIAQDGKPTDDQLAQQRAVRAAVANAAQHVNLYAPDGRAKSLALTHLEEALMWAGKAIFQPEGTR